MVSNIYHISQLMAELMLSTQLPLSLTLSSLIPSHSYLLLTYDLWQLCYKVSYSTIHDDCYNLVLSILCLYSSLCIFIGINLCLYYIFITNDRSFSLGHWKSGIKFYKLNFPHSFLSAYDNYTLQVQLWPFSLDNYIQWWRLMVAQVRNKKVDCQKVKVKWILWFNVYYICI